MLYMFCAVYSQAQNVTQADIDAQQQVVTNAADDITKINKQIAAILRQTAAKNSAARNSKDTTEKAQLITEANALKQQANTLKDKVKAMKLALAAAKKDLAALKADFRKQPKLNTTVVLNGVKDITPINNNVQAALTPKPDLKVTMTNFRNSGVDDSDPNMFTVSVNCGIKNVGTLAVSNVGLTVSMQVEGRSSAYTVFFSEVILQEPIAPNQTKNGTYIFKIPYSSFTSRRPTAPYSRKVKLIIDNSKLIIEANEGNNVSNEFNVVVR